MSVHGSTGTLQMGSSEGVRRDHELKKKTITEKPIV